MELEATILERLQELRRWQVEQQERLLKQQQEQRDLLSSEQDRMYQALGLSIQNIVSDDSLAAKSDELPGKEDANHPTDCPEIFVSETSFREVSPKPNDHEDLISSRNVVDAEIDENPLKTELTVPPLQLSTSRSLNFKSSIDCFSPRSEISVDRETSLVSTSFARTPEMIGERHDELVMEGVEPLPIDKPVKKFMDLDDLPVPSPKKNFETLLEERLRDCKANGDESSDARNTKNRVKRPFLRKGEGLARFKPNNVGNSSSGRARKRATSVTTNTRQASNTTGTRNNSTKLKETPKSSRTCRIYGKNTTVPAVAQAKLTLKNVPSPKNIVHGKSMNAAVASKNNKNTSPNKIRAKQSTIDMNSSSDIETKNRRELEEMRIFELLEEKAENSSFCSNSSTVLALFRQSTPFKTRVTAIGNTRENKKSPNVEKSPMRETSDDANLEEIVRSTRTNMLVPVSPVRKICETVIHEDYVISKWETGSQTNENINTSNSNGSSNRSIAAETYKTTKHTTIQFNNNNNNNNDDNAPIIDSNCANRCKYDDNNYDIADKRAAKNSETENEAANVSLHVRFSEYNEYKTIDLTDTSIMSNDSNTARNYTNDKAWSDRSTSPESSDVEFLLSKNERNIVTRSSSTDVKGSMGILTKSKKKMIQCYRDEESTDQTTDDEDEDYTSVCSNEESYDEENITITDIMVEPEKSKIHENENNRESNSSSSGSTTEQGSENCNDSGSTIGQENDEITTIMIDSNDTIFKSSLLKTRLAELEREIDIFRKENAALAVERKKLHDEMRKLEKDYKLKEDNLLTEKRRSEEILKDERKRLSREKAALESRLREAREKSLQNKQERQDMQILREQLEELREDTRQKESRWQASQARQKSQIRVLQTDNSRLRQELEKLRGSRASNLRNRRQQVTSNTRSINKIGKELDGKRNKNVTRKDSTSDEEISTLRIIAHGETVLEKPQSENDDRASVIDLDGSKTIVYDGLAQQSSVKSDDDLLKKRNMYANLLNEATKGLRGNEEIILGKSDDKSSSEKLQQQEAFNEEQEAFNERQESSEMANGSDLIDKKQLDVSLSRSSERTRKNSQSSVSINSENIAQATENRFTNERNNEINDPQESRFTDVPVSRNERNNRPTINQQDIRKVECSDGHLEYWYPNGNVQKIYPDRNVTKMIYYNGDVRENLDDGSVKYFYASTRTWHTTLPDGLEILQFPDGQVEKRKKNGENEVSFADGSVRLLQVDGTEKWILPDGTVAETFPDGNKILSFPNGQREVHTAEHKRREYPDGTVKLVYPDGTQETRYSTGRVRVKDKYGNLLVDVHHR